MGTFAAIPALGGTTGFIWGAVSGIPLTGQPYASATLLSDGSVLLLPDFSVPIGNPAEKSVARLYPSATGSYVNGTMVTMTPPPYISKFGPILIAKNGRLTIYSSEYYDGIGRVQQYNDELDTWEVVYNKSADYATTHDAYAHGPVFKDPLDGRIFHHIAWVTAFSADGRTVLHEFDEQTGFPLAGPTPSSGGTGDFRSKWWGSEAQFAQLPNDTVMHMGQSYRLGQTGFVYFYRGPSDLDWQCWHPGYNGGGLGGTVKSWGTGGWSHMQQGAPRNFFCTQMIGGTGYEVGAMMYSPLTGKMHLVGGQGRMYDHTPLPAGYDPRIPQPATWASGPNLPRHSITQGWFLHSDHDGQTITQILAGDTLKVLTNGTTKDPNMGLGEQAPGTVGPDQASFDADNYPASGGVGTYRRFWIKTSDGKEHCITWGTSGGIVAGLITVHGLRTITDYEDGLASVAHTNDPVSRISFRYHGQDSPGVVMPSGQMLFIAGHNETLYQVDTSQGFNIRSKIFRYDGATLTDVGKPSWYQYDPPSSTPSQHDNTWIGPGYNNDFVLLPNGEVFCLNEYRALIYQPDVSDGTPNPAWAPTISSAPSAAENGHTYQITGTQMNGLSEACYFGDDKSGAQNFPIVRLRNVATNAIYYCRTHDWTYFGIAPGRSSTVKFDVPTSVPAGAYKLTVLGGGTMVPSAERDISIQRADIHSGVRCFASGIKSVTRNSVLRESGTFTFGGEGYGVGTFGSDVFGRPPAAKRTHGGGQIFTSVHLTASGNNVFSAHMHAGVRLTAFGSNPTDIAEIMVYTPAGQWELKPLLRWNGTEWVLVRESRFERWDGTQWLPARKKIAIVDSHLHAGARFTAEGFQRLVGEAILHHRVSLHYTSVRHAEGFGAQLHCGARLTATGFKSPQFGDGDFGGGTFGNSQNWVNPTIHAGVRVLAAGQKKEQGGSVLSAGAHMIAATSMFGDGTMGDGTFGQTLL